MKKKIVRSAGLLLLLLFAGCSSAEEKTITAGVSAVEQVLAAQTATAAGGEETLLTTAEPGSDPARTESEEEETVALQTETIAATAGETEDGVLQAETMTEGKTTGEEAATTEVDIDLTEMSSDMVYATVYQMRVSPEDYIGKTVRISGQYYATYYSATGLYYHYCLISDATSCCAQGLEFIWGEGEHSYPEEYPGSGTEVVIVGTFCLYEELGYWYCCLAGATLEWEQE